jgi:hypothetical protein
MPEALWGLVFVISHPEKQGQVGALLVNLAAERRETK